MHEVIERAARRRRARFGVTERLRAVLPEPKEIRRHDRERDDGGDPRSGSGQPAARVAVEEQKQRQRRRQDHHEIFRPPGEPERDAEQDPMAQLVLVAAPA